jgi:hypothetical protein
VSRKSRKKNQVSRKTPRAPSVLGIDGDGNVVRIVVNSNYSKDPADRDAAYKEQTLTNWLQNEGLYHDAMRDKVTEEAWLAKHKDLIAERRAASADRQKSLDPTRETLDEAIKGFASSVKATENQPSAELMRARSITKKRMSEPVEIDT